MAHAASTQRTSEQQKDNMKLGLWNNTKQRWVCDADSDDGGPCEFDSYSDALKALDRVNELKRLNPENKDDAITVSPRQVFEQPRTT